MKTKRGDMFDLLFMMVALLVISVFLLFSHMIAGQIQLGFLNNSDSINTTFTGNTQGILEKFDLGMGFIVFGLIAFIIISGFFIRTHPIFFIGSIIMFIMFVFISSTITNTFDKIIEADNVTDSADSFPITVGLMRNMPVLITVVGLLFIIVLYAKFGGGGTSTI